jgi:hypothetical protein
VFGLKLQLPFGTLHYSKYLYLDQQLTTVIASFLFFPVY